MPKKILLIRWGNFGDLVNCSAVLPVLRTAYPQAEIHFLVQNAFSIAVSGHPALTRTIKVANARELWSFIAKHRKSYDLVLDLHGSIPTEHVPLAALPPNQWQWIVPDFEIHAVNYFLKMASRAGVPMTPTRSQLVLPEAAVNQAAEKLASLGISDRRFIALFPFTSKRNREWPLANFFSLLPELQRRTGLPALLMGSGSERARVEPFLNEMCYPSVCNLVGALTLEETCALCQHAAVILCGDSGPMHIAIANSIPFVALFGPSRREVAIAPQSRGIVVQKQIPPYHLYYRRAESGGFMDSIKVSEVAEAIEQALLLPPTAAHHFHYQPNYAAEEHLYQLITTQSARAAANYYGGHPMLVSMFEQLQTFAQSATVAEFCTELTTSRRLCFPEPAVSIEIDRPSILRSARQAKLRLDRWRRRIFSRVRMLGLIGVAFIFANAVAYFVDQSPVYRMPSPELINVGRRSATFEFARPSAITQTIRLNKFGFRDREWSINKQPSTLRLAVIGDSMTEAKEVAEEETAVRLLEKFANQHHDGSPTIEVMNFGVGGYGWRQYAKLLELRVLEYRPDYVLFISYGNDLLDDLRYDAFQEHLQSISGRLLTLTYSSAAYESIPLYRLAYLKLFKWVLDTATTVSTSAERYDRLLKCAETNQSLSDCAPGTAESLASIEKLLKSHRIPWSVVVIPLTVEIIPSQLEKLKSTLSDWEQHGDVLTANRLAALRIHFQQHLEQQGISHLNLADRISSRSLPAQQELYLLADEHFNKNGQAFLATEAHHLLRDWYQSF